jgi:hypothetical protein
MNPRSPLNDGSGVCQRIWPVFGSSADHEPHWISWPLAVKYRTVEQSYGVAFLRVRGIERVRQHADLTMFGRLALALSRARAIPLAG